MEVFGLKLNVSCKKYSLFPLEVGTQTWLSIILMFFFFYSKFLQKEVDRPTRNLQLVAFVHLPFSFWSFDLFVASLLFRRSAGGVPIVRQRSHEH